MRAFAENVYGIPPEQVIGSTGKLKYELRDGKPVLVKLPALEFVDDKEGKPIAIQRIIGRRPIAAFGNSDGDLQMLQWTCAGNEARLCVYIRLQRDLAAPSCRVASDSPLMRGHYVAARYRLRHRLA
jgi:hypothetical protein